MSVGEDLDAVAARELAPAVEALGGWESVSPDLYRKMYQKWLQGLLEREQATEHQREPGWQVPWGQRNQWPIYVGEAVTFGTDWGAVTLGRGLARMYDLDGWPDADTLKTMAVQQAAGPTLGKGA